MNTVLSNCSNFKIFLIIDANSVGTDDPGFIQLLAFVLRKLDSTDLKQQMLDEIIVPAVVRYGNIKNKE